MTILNLASLLPISSSSTAMLRLEERMEVEENMKGKKSTNTENVLVISVMIASCYIFGKIPPIQYVAVQYKGWTVTCF